ncbi:DUF3293 domain-containing protein [Mycobacteroides salmoniphilum]|uniref:hypothetical protein n=1 Tax=Mycobacteroides salmoniphilum TaxID=404941 RepID=UPI0035634E99
MLTTSVLPLVFGQCMWWGSELDCSYGEKSRAVFGLAGGEARGLGRRFRQVAVFV